jgi:hypothetical protein
MRRLSKLKPWFSILGIVISLVALYFARQANELVQQQNDFVRQQVTSNLVVRKLGCVDI